VPSGLQDGREVTDDVDITLDHGVTVDDNACTSLLQQPTLHEDISAYYRDVSRMRFALQLLCTVHGSM